MTSRSLDATTSNLSMRGFRLAVTLVAVALLAVVLVPSPAPAQATRTWVSGVGDDANPCSRTAPCKTFAGAISKTATNGEINTLDPGGFGGVTITKSITINACTSGFGGVLVSGTNAIVINALTTSNVTLKCLDINGLGTSLNAVRVLQAQRVRVIRSQIWGFTRHAVDIENSNTTGLRVLVARNDIYDNLGSAVLVAPTLNGANAIVSVRNNDIFNNGCGITAAQFGMDPAFGFATNCGTRASVGVSAIALVNAFGNHITGQTTVGVFSRGAQAIQRIGTNEIVSNGTGLSSVDSGGILSFGNNMITGNSTNGAPTGALIPLARRKY